MSDSGAFSLSLGDGTEFAASIQFEPNDDICGEGYRGFDVAIQFDDTKLNSWMWSETYRGDRKEVRQDAADLYNEIVRLIKAAQS